jgi:hypothetical protein
MKAAILGLAVATVAFGGSSIYLWQQLDTERERAAQVEKTSQELKARIAALEKARTELAGRRMVTSGGFITGQFSSHDPVVAAPAPPPTSAGKKEGEPDQPVWTVQRRDPSPAMLKMMRTQMRANNRRMYADVGEKVGLNKETASKLVDLLSEQQAANVDFFRTSDDAEAGRRAEQRQRDNETAINDLIGADKAMALEEYQKSIPARMEVDMLARQLENNEIKLSDEQRKRLVDVYVEERARVPEPQVYEGMDSAEYAKVANAWQEDYQKRVSAEAGRILNPDQLTAYNEIQQWQQEMRQNIMTAPSGPMMRMHRGFGSANAVTFSAAPAISMSVEGRVAEAPEEKKP